MKKKRASQYELQRRWYRGSMHALVVPIGRVGIGFRPLFAPFWITGCDGGGTGHVVPSFVYVDYGSGGQK